MDYSEIPLFKLVGRRMNWLNQRQAVLAHNIANSDTPNFRPSDLDASSFKALVQGEFATGFLEPTRTNQAHMVVGGSMNGEFAVREQKDVYETNLSGNAVSLEEQLIKIGETEMDYQLATNVYRKYVGMFRLALGRGGR
jgi:flagellar basal-body rod protein FlgB